jgi:predicted nucleic acid-binding protein
MEDVLRRKFSFTPMPDNRILECGVAAGSDFIVSGDKDLLQLGRYDSIRILNPSDLLELVQAQGRHI